MLLIFIEPVLADILKIVFVGIVFASMILPEVVFSFVVSFVV